MAYGTNTALTAYLALTGRTLTGDADQARQAGSLYIDATYAHRFKSTALSFVAEFPRFDYDPTPERVEFAAYEAAYLWGLDNNALSVTASASGVVKREKVEGAVEVEYFENTTKDGTVTDATPRFSVIEGLLYPFIRKEGGYFPSAFVV